MTRAHEDTFFILVRTRFASNLGSAVRAMENMGFPNLILVQPECEVGVEARSFAMRGARILDRAAVSTSLEEAGQGLNLLVGTTGRFRGERPHLITSRTLVEEVLPRCSPSRVGIVFGSEDNGLRREELRLCHWLVEISTASDYPVINLAQAVAIVAYELNLSFRDPSPSVGLNAATPEELESLMRRVEGMLQAFALPVRLSLPRLMQRIRKVAVRAQLEKEDINMLHGLLKELGKKVG